MNEIRNEKSEKMLNITNSENHQEIINNEKNSLILPKEKYIRNNKFDIIKENLMFEYNIISPFKLYFHFSGKFEIFIMILAIIATIASGCSEALKFSLIGDALTTLSTLIPDNLNNDIDNIMIDIIEPKINTTIKKFLIYGSIIFIFDFLSIFFWFFFDLRLIHNFEINYFSLILKQEQGWFDKHNSFKFSTKVQAQLEGIENGLQDNQRYVILFIIEIVSGYIVGFKTSWELTLILSTCSLPFIIVGYYMNLYGLEKQKIIDLKMEEKAGGIAEELLYNIKTVASFANFDYELKRYNDAFKSNDISDTKTLTPDIVMEISLFGVYFGFVITSIYARSLVVSEYNIENAHLVFTSGDVITVLLSVRDSILIMYYLFPIFLTIKESCACASDYFYLYERIPKIYISQREIKPNRDSIKGKIEFKNIKFIYPNDENKKYILNGLNLSIESGKKVALVGESGCGRTTIMRLIERLYEPSEGEILLDGINIKDYNLEYLRSLFGFVKQEHFLFNHTIKHNVVFGREDSIKEIGDIDALLKEACTIAAIEDFIQTKPNKYDYNVGVNGNKLLPGYKQCLTIARAIFAKPKIIILDKPITGLDYEEEKKVLKALDTINKQNITIIMIESQLNILKNSDMIYVLKDGKVIEQGNHKELMDNNGYYTGLIKSEFKMKKFMKLETFEEKSKMRIIRKFSKKKNYLTSNTLRYQLGQKNKQHVKFSISKIFELIKNYKMDLFIGTISGLFFGVGLTYIEFIIGKLETDFSLKDNDLMKRGVLKWSFILLLVALVWVYCDYVCNLKLNNLGSIVESKTRKKLIKKYLELQMGFFDFESNSSSSLLSILSIDTNYLGFFFRSIYNSILVSFGLILAVLIIGFLYNWRLTLILLIFIPIRVFFVYFAGKYKYDGRKKYKEISIKARSFFSECVTNTRSIFSFNFQNGAINMYKNILDQEYNYYIKDTILLGLCIASINFLSYIANSMAYKYGIIFFRQKTINFESLIQVKKTIMSFIDNEFYFWIHDFWDYSKVITAFKYIYKILNNLSEINAFENANKDKKSINKLKGKIEFRNVTFSYHTKPTQNVLEKVSFIIPPGKKAAIIGNTESGKSTILQLIERFYDVFKGEILIDDLNIKNYNLFDLRKRIGLIRQEEEIFNRGIYENILYGNLNASKDEVYNAANEAGVGKLLNLNEPYKKKCFSEGEKQKINIARMFLKNPDILLLDNVTSSLDPNSENEINKSISIFQKGRTSITITHKLSNIVDYDIILYMEKGKLVEVGTHSQLMEKKGKYFNLYINEK